VSVVVSDTSPLHYLILCDAVEVLSRLFRQVVIPPTVFQELPQPKIPAPVRPWTQALPRWVTVQAPKHLDPLLEVD
jgi:predicted nucleic acid-binding protein